MRQTPRGRKARAGQLVELDAGEAEGVEERGEGGAGVVAGGFEDIVLEGGVLQGAFGFKADLAFEIGIRGRKEAGVAGVDAGFGIVEAGDEDLRLGKAKHDGVVADGDVLWLELAEVHAGDDFAMDDEEEAVTGEEFGEDGIFVFAGDDFVHGELNGFEALELLNLANDGGLVHADDGAAGERAEQAEEAGAGDAPDGDADGESGEEGPREETGEKGAGPEAWRTGRIGRVCGHRERLG